MKPLKSCSDCEPKIDGYCSDCWQGLEEEEEENKKNKEEVKDEIHKN